MRSFNRSGGSMILRIISLLLISSAVMFLLINSSNIIYSQTTPEVSSGNITVTYTYTLNTTITTTQTVYPETTVFQTTLYTSSIVNNVSVNTTIIQNITTIYFRELPTYTYTEYKVLSITTTRPPELTERATWISAGIFVGVLAGLTVGYAYYARGISVRAPKRK